MVALDNVITVPANLLGRTLRYLSAEEELQLARAVVLAYDLELPPPRMTDETNRPRQESESAPVLS